MQFRSQARVIYFLLTFGWVLFLKFNANYLNTFGLDSAEIGIINTTSWSVGILIGPMWGMVLDRYQSPNSFLSLKYLSFPLAYTTMQFILRDQNTFLSLLLCNLLAQCLWYGSNEITDAIIINSIDNQDKIGEIKFTGSIGMLFGSSYGVIASYFGWDYSVLLCIFLLTSLSLFVRSYQPFVYIKKKQSFNMKAEITKLLRKTNIRIVYLSSVLFWSTFFIIDCFVWLYLEREFQASMFFIGCCLLAQKLPEIFVSYNTEFFISRLGYKGMQLVAFMVLCVRFFLLSLLTQQNYLWGAIMTEAMHSFSLIFMSVASMLMINKFSPKSLISTSQTINSSLNRVGSLIGGSVSSYVYKIYGGQKLMFMAGTSVFIMMIFYCLVLYFFFDDDEQVDVDLPLEQELIRMDKQAST